MEDNNEIVVGNVVPFPKGELEDSDGQRVRALSEEEHKRIDGYKEELWSKVSELMEAGGFQSSADFDFKMSTWVQNLAMWNQADKELVVQAGNEIQRRFLMVMEAAAKEAEKQSNTESRNPETTKGDL